MLVHGGHWPLTTRDTNFHVKKTVNLTCDTQHMIIPILHALVLSTPSHYTGKSQNNGWRAQENLKVTSQLQIRFLNKTYSLQTVVRLKTLVYERAKSDLRGAALPGYTYIVLLSLFHL